MVAHFFAKKRGAALEFVEFRLMRLNKFRLRNGQWLFEDLSQFVR